MDGLSKEELLSELRKRDALIAVLREENALLGKKVDFLIRRIFGSSSEKISKDQLELLLSGEEPASEEAGDLTEEVDSKDHESKAKAKRGPRGKARWPEDLPVVVEVIEPEEVKENPGKWRKIGEERTERLDFQRAYFVRQVTVRPKYVEIDLPEAAPIIADLPPNLQDRCTAAPGLLAQILVAKYCDHLPLYRQEKIYYQRHDIWLPRQNMATWIELCAFWLEPIYQLLRLQVFGDGYAQVDETAIRYLEPGIGKCGHGYLWTACRPGEGVVFHWETSRGAQCLDNIIPVDFRGTVQCDGYSAYGAFAARREGIELVACLAHIRREIYEARDQAPIVAGFLLRQIRNLYGIERRLRNLHAGPVLRQAVRAAESRPIFTRIQKVMTAFRSRYFPKSALGKALTYALAQWPRMERWLDDGRLEIDNNLVENAIRPTAIGKKNWMFFGSADAGQRSAIIYTIIENCRFHCIDPYAYLCDVLTRLPGMTNHQVAEITPKAWANARRGCPHHLPAAA